jgi:hypothetical protein
MNNKTYLLFVLFLALFACNKGSIDLSKKDNSLMGYHLDGLYDLTLNSYSISDGEQGKVKLRLSVVDDSGFHEGIFLSAEGMPLGVSANFKPAQNAAPFVSELVFALTGIPKPGKYPITIKMTNSDRKEIAYSMFLTIPIVDFYVEKIGGTGTTMSDDIHIYSDRLNENIVRYNVSVGDIADTVHLSYSNLPSGVTAIFERNNFPFTYETRVSFKATNTSAGRYPISLEATSKSGIHKSYSTSLEIKEECNNDKASKNYDFLRYQDGKLVDSIFEYVEIIKDPTYINRLIISAKKYGTMSNNYIQLQLNCADNSIKIINEGAIIESNNVSLTGIGSYNPSTKDYVLDCTINGYLKSPIILRKK